MSSKARIFLLSRAPQ